MRIGTRTRFVQVAGNYLDDLSHRVSLIDRERLADLVGAVVTAMESGRGVLIAGNGGSSSTAAHMCHDLNAASREVAVTPGYAIGLADNTPALTAVANDHSYDQVFARQVDVLGRPGDLYVAISVSGASPNVLAGAKAARARAMQVVSLLGAAGPLYALSDHAVAVGGGDYGLSEDIHLAVNHMMVRALRRVERHVCDYPSAQEVF
ncbi:D-sedoheptulose-7-phosphate isomerase [Streptomyces sp. NPDC054770]